MRGKSPTPDDFGYIPTGGEIYFDGEEAPNGWEETTDPTGGGSASVYSQILFYAHTDEDTGATHVNHALIDQAHYNDYETYLTYNSEEKKLYVVSDFLAVIVPWCECDRSAGAPPEMGLKINSTMVFDAISCDNTTGAVGGLSHEYNGFANNLYFRRLHAGDSIAMQKDVDRGWAIGHLKIYKLFGFEHGSTMDSLLGLMGGLNSDTNPNNAKIEEN